MIIFTSLCCGIGDWGEKRKKRLLIERREQKTRDLKSEFALLGMKFAKKTRHNFLNVKDELFEDVSLLLKNKISRSAMNKLELFGHGYLIGGAVKWRQPFALKDIAETLGCTDEYQHYIKLFQAYISERSIRSNCGEKINLFTDKEWWVNEDDDQVQDLADVIDAVENHFSEDRFSIQEKRSKEEGEKDKAVAAVNRNRATADQNTTTEEELPYLAGGNVKIKHLNIIQIS